MNKFISQEISVMKETEQDHVMERMWGTALDEFQKKPLSKGAIRAKTWKQEDISHAKIWGGKRAKVLGQKQIGVFEEQKEGQYERKKVVWGRFISTGREG